MEWKGSFIGFTYGDRHSSTLGIFRTSNSNRYDIRLTPNIKDITANLEGFDGTRYYGSFYTKREIPISFAFFGLTEKQLVLLKQTLNDNQIHDLILDEEPYKVWSVKLTSIAIAKHVCFEGDEGRFYCGEGTLTFTSFSPYARSRFEYIEDYTEDNISEWNENGKHLPDENYETLIYPAILEYDFNDSTDTARLIGLESSFKLWLEDVDLLTDSEIELEGINSYIEVFRTPGIYNNLEEWRDASRIPSNTKYGIYENGEYLIYNAGDAPTPFKLYLPVMEIEQTFIIECNGQQLELRNIAAKNGDEYVLIDSHDWIVWGCNSEFVKTKNIYNNKLIGEFFDLPQGEIRLKVNSPGYLDFRYLYL